MRTLGPAPGKQEIPLFQIVGPKPRGRRVDYREKLITAIRASPRPSLSFQGIRSAGEQFVVGCLGPALFFAADQGRPVRALNLTASVAADLHDNLLEIGALLPDLDRNRVLGAGERLTAAHQAAQAGAWTAPELAVALGTSARAAAGDLRLLDHWGIGPMAADEAFAGDLAAAA